MIIFNKEHPHTKIYFSKSIRNKKLKLLIKVSNNSSSIYYFAYRSNKISSLGYLDVYDNFYKRSNLKIHSVNNLKAKLIGEYSWALIFDNIKYNFLTKPKLYGLYFLVLFLLFLLIIFFNFKYFHHLIFKNLLSVVRRKLLERRSFWNIF